MRVPTSALDGCSESFFAADEKREKASTQFFADTGVMAMLCHHDRVLWLVNMMSAGEKQHYALALIKKLFDNIPPEMTVGLLYDIGCQLHRSCLKYRLLNDDVLRWITFAISVFHAYGHQWACQIIYRPCKCEGFGLSDGEGCECLWSALKHLIAPLHISGVRHLDDKNLVLFGSWLSRRWNNCAKKKSNVMQALHELSVDETPVCQQWKLQVEYQMRPLPHKCHVGRSKTSNDKEISKILSIKKSLAELDGSLRRMKMQLCTGNVNNLVDFNLRLIEERAHRSRLADTLSRWKVRLGINQCTHLDQLRHNVYLQRKFEIEKLERSYRQTFLCVDLSALIRQRHSPPNAIVPNPISLLPDIGLDDIVLEPPDWLADEVTRAAIRLVLEIDQCDEEELRVKVERCALQEWAIVEWDALQRARAYASDDELMDVLEDIALADQYRGEEVDYIEDGYAVNDSVGKQPN
ncbi:uncharacterized protein EDB93DRAFT_1237430 [Suillus bovinus]|uniref:uncharacterized protein n=1 Tax=Suillus bovinus TaxID=48563 RepID=UPI001B883474|nr:uncharacterized protein EDB93DRAFT_1237430 [Suillus bovinus]KAG2159205.1 hypothetical protein EDB93DRAFT_1237430 [Suillus bovinus]